MTAITWTHHPAVSETYAYAVDGAWLYQKHEWDGRWDVTVTLHERDGERYQLGAFVSDPEAGVRELRAKIEWSRAQAPPVKVDPAKPMQTSDYYWRGSYVTSVPARVPQPPGELEDGC